MPKMQDHEIHRKTEGHVVSAFLEKMNQMFTTSVQLKDQHRHSATLSLADQSVCGFV